jgi:lipopolysaccharide export LptBFGC system permease protein LptF
VLPQLREPIRKAIAISRSGLLRPDGVYDPVYDLHIQVRHYYPDSKIAEGVLIRHWTLSPKGQREEKLFVDAERMVWMPEPGAETRLERGRWRLFNGSMQRWDPGGNLMVNAKEKGFDHLKRPFAEHDLETSLVPIDLETSDQDVSYLSWRELRAQYQRQPQDKSLLVKLHHHFAFPLSHLVLLLLGIPFVLNFHSRSLVLGLAACFFLAAGYFLMGSMAVSLASDPGNPLLPPVIAAWLPNVLFGSLGLTVFTNLRS